MTDLEKLREILIDNIADILGSHNFEVDEIMRLGQAVITYEENISANYVLKADIIAGANEKLNQAIFDKLAPVACMYGEPGRKCENPDHEDYYEDDGSDQDSEVFGECKCELCPVVSQIIEEVGSHD